jgi:NADP-dependent 3-hydroxy acid dehydrogenase YdfG
MDQTDLMDEVPQSTGSEEVSRAHRRTGSRDRTAVRLSEGLRQEVKTWNLRTTIISPGAVATELPNSITEPDIATGIGQFNEHYAIPADSFARAAAFAISQPEDVDINEILFRPTRQEL